jgi:hypothetical protein
MDKHRRGRIQIEILDYEKQGGIEVFRYNMVD